MLPSFKEEILVNDYKNKRQLKQDWKDRNNDFEGDIRNQQLENDEDYIDIIKCDKGHSTNPNQFAAA